MRLGMFALANHTAAGVASPAGRSSRTNSTPICWTKCQILEEKTVMRAKEGTQSPGKRNMVEGSSKTLVGRAAVMLLIPAPAGALANNRKWSAWGMGGGLRWGGTTAQSSTITNGMLA